MTIGTDALEVGSVVCSTQHQRHNVVNFLRRFHDANSTTWPTQRLLRQHPPPQPHPRSPRHTRSRRARHRHRLLQRLHPPGQSPDPAGGEVGARCRHHATPPNVETARTPQHAPSTNHRVADDALSIDQTPPSGTIATVNNSHNRGAGAGVSPIASGSATIFAIRLGARAHRVARPFRDLQPQAQASQFSFCRSSIRPSRGCIFLKMKRRLGGQKSGCFLRRKIHFRPSRIMHSAESNRKRERRNTLEIASISLAEIASRLPYGNTETPRGSSRGFPIPCSRGPSRKITRELPARLREGHRSASAEVKISIPKNSERCRKNWGKLSRRPIRRAS